MYFGRYWQKGAGQTEMDLNLGRGGMRGVSRSNLLIAIGTRNSGRNRTKSTTLMIDPSLETPIETNKGLSKGAHS